MAGRPKSCDKEMESRLFTQKCDRCAADRLSSISLCVGQTFGRVPLRGRQSLPTRKFLFSLFSLTFLSLRLSFYLFGPEREKKEKEKETYTGSRPQHSHCDSEREAPVFVASASKRKETA
jgi:hypothetical protein